MRILIAPDKFKGSLTAEQVGAAVKSAILEFDHNFETKVLPLADGGEGTCDMLTEFSGGTKVVVEVCDPLGRNIQAYYGLSGDGKKAFIEMAVASGLQLLSINERDPLRTTTYGTGQLIAHALRKGVDEIIMGIGGSGTNDGGIGMAAALGAKFLSSSGDVLEPIGNSLQAIHTIDLDALDPILKNVSVTALCDVDNPLYGPHGAAYTFAPQKGADAATVKLLDEGLQHYAEVVRKQVDIDLNFPGAGAGGGLSAGARLLFNISFVPGMDFITEYVQLETLIQQSDLVITGEGKMDIQTLSGKVVKGVAKLCKKHHKKLIALVGINTLSAEQITELGIHKVITLVNNKTSETEAMKNAGLLIAQRVKEDILSDFNLR